MFTRYPACGRNRTFAGSGRNFGHGCEEPQRNGEEGGLGKGWASAGLSSRALSADITAPTCRACDQQAAVLSHRCEAMQQCSMTHLGVQMNTWATSREPQGHTAARPSFKYDILLAQFNVPPAFRLAACSIVSLQGAATRGRARCGGGFGFTLGLSLLILERY